MIPAIPAEMICYRFSPSLTSPVEERVPIPEPKDDEVLLKVLAAGVCHSDVGMFDPTSNIHRALSIGTFTGGHEGAGVYYNLDELRS